MSDFDKEAEREKLRKKYADDEDDRADTKRMSELLLKGATMTNQHCDTCGDPLFSHNDQTFCPTCQAGAQESADNGAAQRPAADGDAQPARDAGSTDHNAGSTAQQSPATKSSAQQPPTEQSTSQSSPTPQQPSTTPQSPSPTPQSSAQQPATDRQPESPATNGRASDTTSPTATDAPTSQGSPADNGAAPPADLTTARQSLVGTVTRFSQRAAKADDPRRAKELLAAAREAAETLRALEFE
jgi:Uncharacterized Zn-finger containing protein